MADFDNTNRGALFKNKDKDNEQQPDYNGKLNVGGDEFYISAWLKTSKKGEKFMSLSVKPVSQRAGARTPKRDESADEDIPFAPIGKRASLAQ
jgi:hypothetical protein